MEETKKLRELPLIKNLKCIKCGKTYGHFRFTCEKHFSILKVEYKKELYDEIKRKIENNELNFFEKLKLVSLGEGNTPLIKSKQIGKKFGIDLFYKNETINPTGSFKDRSASLSLSIGKQLGFKNTFVISSGNMAISTSMYSRMLDMQSIAFVPFHTHSNKKKQLLYYQPNSYFFEISSLISKISNKTSSAILDPGFILNYLLFGVNKAWLKKWSGMYEKMIKNGFYPMGNVLSNPFIAEGYQEISFEIFKAVGVPDVILTPIGSGDNLWGEWIGWKKLKKMELAKKLPKMVGIQRNVGVPFIKKYRGGTHSLRAIKESKGAWVGVDSISKNSVLRIIDDSGVFCESISSTVIGGLEECIDRSIICKGDMVLCILTGSGLKDAMDLTHPEYRKIRDDEIKKVLEGYLEDDERR